MGSPGKYIRWLCLIALLSYQIYFLLHGFSKIKNKEGEMGGIYTCEDNILNVNNETIMTQCYGSDDATSCREGVQCIRSSCGRPLFPHIGVSYAGSSDPFDADAGTSTQSFLTILSLLYSLLPYVLRFFFTIHFLALGNVVPLTRLVLMDLVFLVNDVVLKNIANQPRPMGSCLYFHSHGMPSGHAATSMGLLTFLLLELLFYHPNLFGTRSATSPRTQIQEVDEGGDAFGLKYPFMWGYGWRKPPLDAAETNDLEEIILSGDAEESSASSSEPKSDSVLESTSLSLGVATTRSSDPLSCSALLSPQQGHYIPSEWLHHYRALLWTLLLLPIPLSRVYLHDHSPWQITVGSIVGVFLGTMWYFCMRRGELLCRSGGANNGVNSKHLMKCLVNSHFGKYLGLNLGMKKMEESGSTQ